MAYAISTQRDIARAIKLKKTALLQPLIDEATEPDEALFDRARQPVGAESSD
jgi:hypothetical protein